jgi:hypothetical protein
MIRPSQTPIGTRVRVHDGRFQFLGTFQGGNDWGIEIHADQDPNQPDRSGTYSPKQCYRVTF